MNLISLAHVNCGKTFLVHREAPPVPQTRTVLDEASVATIRVGRLTALTKIQKMILVLEKDAGMERFALGVVPEPDAYVLHAA